MDNVNSILVVVNRSADSRYVLEKAAAVASTTPGGARVHVIRVIYEQLVEHDRLGATQSQSLKLYLMQAEEEYLVDLIKPHARAFASLDSATLWNKRVSDAVVQAARDFDADLIIKATDADTPHFPRHPDDWNLLRHAGRPVMLVKELPWVIDPVIMTAVDALDDDHLDLSRRILRAGDGLARALQGRLHIVSAFPRTTPWGADPNVVVDFERLRTDLEAEVRERLEAATVGPAIAVTAVHLDEGHATDVVSQAVRATRAEVLVMGTLAREGLRAFVIGNTSEKLLNMIDCDVLVIHT